jgi:hypothetical protein
MKRKSRKIKGGFIHLNQTEQGLVQTGKDVVQTGKDIVDASIELVVSLKDLGVSIFKEIDSVTHIHQEINNVSSQTSPSTIPTFNSSPSFTTSSFS